MSFSDILHCVKHSKGMNGTCNLYERYQYVLTHEAYKAPAHEIRKIK